MLNLENASVMKSYKLTEVFSSFMEKISYYSNDCPSNLEKIANFKREMLMNMQSRKKLSEIHQIEKSPQHKSSFQLNDNTILSTRETSPCTWETSVPSLNSPHVSAFDDQSSLSIFRAASYSESNSKKESEEPIDILGLPTNPSWSQKLTKDQFYDQVKPSYHPEMSKITSTLNDLGFARRFDAVSETTFYALCFAFFESYLKELLNNARTSLSDFIILRLGSFDTNIQQSLGNLESQFVSLTRNMSRRNTIENDVIESFYQAIATNYDFYKSCLVVFKRIMIKILEQKELDTASRKNSLQWISDVNNVEKDFYEGLTQLYKANICFLILTPTKFIEKRFNLMQNPLSAGMKSSSSPELRIFIDKFLISTYVLHPLTLDEGDRLSFKLEKQRSYSPNISREPTFLKVLQETSDLNKKIKIEEKEKEKEQTKAKKSLTSSQIKKLVLPPRPHPLNLISNLEAKKPDAVVNNTLETSFIKRYPTPSPTLSPSPSPSIDFSSSKNNFYLPNSQKTFTYDVSLNNAETKSYQNIPKPLDLPPNQEKPLNLNIKVESLYDKLIREIHQKVDHTRAESPLLTRPNYPFKEERTHQRNHSYSESTKNHFDINYENLTRVKKESKPTFTLFEEKKILPEYIFNKVFNTNKVLQQDNHGFNEITIKHLRNTTNSSTSKYY